MNSKIYTRSGDAGETSLFNGERVSKSDSRIEVIGEVDELSALLSIAHDLLNAHEIKQSMHAALAPLRQDLVRVIEDLFKLNANIAGAVKFQDLDLSAEVLVLEQSIDLMQAELAELTNFIYQFGHPAVSHLQLTRSVCRRVERKLLMLAHFVFINQSLACYLNRLADWLFVLARLVAKILEIPEQVVLL